MNLSLNVGYLTSVMSVQETAKLVADAGFDAVDFSLMEMVHPDDPYNGSDYMKLAEETGKIFREMGVPVTQTHTPFTFADFGNPEIYRDAIYPTIVRSIEASAAMGAEVAVVHPLHYMIYAGNEEELFRVNMDFYRSLIPVCKSCGIKVAVENMFQRDPNRKCIVHDTCSTAKEFCRYIDTLDSEYMVACLDVGHVGLPVQKDEAWDMIRALGHERLQALHIHDNNYQNDNHSMPYTGKIAWTKVTQALGEIDYSGDFTYELSLKNIVGMMDQSLYPVVLRYVEGVGRHLVNRVESCRINQNKS